MNAQNAISDNLAQSPHKITSPIRKTLLTPFVCSILAAFGIFGGISALFIGMVSVVLHGLIFSDTMFDNLGTILLIAAIPMILIGSTFLDEIEVKK